MKTVARRILRLFHEVIFKKQLEFGVFILNIFGNRAYCKQLKIKLLKCQEGTVGHGMIRFLTTNGFEFVPHYENHDMKHVLLGYGTTAPDEICMQAFMFGNAGFGLINTSIFLSFVIWTPDVWRDLAYHFLIGRFTKPIGGLRVEGLADRNLHELRQEIGLKEAIEKADLVFNTLQLVPVRQV